MQAYDVNNKYEMYIRRYKTNIKRTLYNDQFRCIYIIYNNIKQAFDNIKINLITFIANKGHV